MYRLTSILIPSLIFLLAACICFLVRMAFSLPALSFFKAFGIGMVLALMEVQLLKRMDEGKLKYLLLDGAIFPFLSMGIAAGFLIG